MRTVADKAQPPAVIDLAQLGAQPGDTLRLRPKGMFKKQRVVWDANRISAVFSAGDMLRPNPSIFGATNRVPGAIDAGNDVRTPRTLW